MIASANKWWTEFVYGQEARHDSLLQFWNCLKMWIAYRPRIVECAFCGIPMWWNGKRDTVYCGPDCAYYGPQLTEYKEDELPF